MASIPSYPHDIFTDDVLLDPHQHYRALRELGPVVWLEKHQVYVVPRYAEVRAVLSDAKTFCSGHGVGLNDVANSFGAGRTTMMSDGDQHTRLRSIMAYGFTPRALRNMQTDVEDLATSRVAQLAEQGTFDAVVDLARALPLALVPDLLGWPAGGRKHLLEWAAASFDLLGPLNDRATRAAATAQVMVESAQKIIEFAEQAFADGESLPGSIGAAMHEAAQRGELGAQQVPLLVFDYIGPSLDTTISAIGSAVWLLASHPDQWAALKADPSLVPNTLNEVLRVESPVRLLSRVTTTATDVGGYALDAGVRLIVLFASANRDDRHFDRADEFDITRHNAGEHIGFGFGVHACAGQGFAKLLSHAVLKALVAQVDTIELGEAVRAVNNLINAFESLPVTVYPTRHPALATS
jgi:cytochrome P450